MDLLLTKTINVNKITRTSTFFSFIKIENLRNCLTNLSKFLNSYIVFGATEPTSLLVLHTNATCFVKIIFYYIINF